MTSRDLIVISMGNLLRMKLRTFLTTSGIVIAITAFVAMLSLGAGSQQQVEEQFNSLGLFWTMQISPASRGALPGTAGPELDLAAVEKIAAVPGVTLVFPYDAFTVQVTLGDSSKQSRAQALPSEALRTKLYAKLLTGRSIESDSSAETIISRQLAGDFGFRRPDSVLGQRLVVATKVSTLDSALAHVVMDRGESILTRLRRVSLDSLFEAGYRSRVIRTEANEGMRRFASGFFGAQETVRETLTVVGVRETSRGGPARNDQVVIPLATARRFASRGMGGGPTEMLSAMTNGSLFGGGQGGGGKSFPHVTLNFDPKTPYKQIRDSIQAMGFRAFSFAEQFEQIQRMFIYFDLALGVIGMIALLTASLGIVNTMVMSITERRREIGVLKSLGADDADIRKLFLVESAVIGALGTGVGILLGWIVTRIVSFAAQGYMREQGLPEMDLFALPPWLLLVAVTIGIGVSVLAGWYPAARAARVDPVEALRGEW
jgi:putative ABC transport system permease protein